MPLAGILGNTCTSYLHWVYSSLSAVGAGISLSVYQQTRGCTAGFDLRQEQDTSLYSTVSKPALGATLPFYPMGTGDFLWGVKRMESEAEIISIQCRGQE
jgi:hypothetical protein